MEKILIYFIILQMLNVVVSTIKSVLTIKGTKLTAAIISSVSYSINIIIVFLVSKDLGLIESVAVTVITNLVGVYTGLTILEKLRKEQLWRIQTTVSSLKVDEYKQSLLDHNIKFISYETSWSEYKVVDIFSSTKEESNIIKEIILEHNAKYTISSNTKYL